MQHVAPLVYFLHRGLAPQNKPELQKVLEKRKREQVIKAQKEEQEAHKKRSDLEIELMKRQQKLEQVKLLPKASLICILNNSLFIFTSFIFLSFSIIQ